MTGDEANPGYCEGYKSGKFVMGVKNSSIFLKISQVDVSDSGSYFCGVYTEGLLYFTGVQLNIKGKTMYKNYPTDKLEVECVFISLKGDKETHEKDNHTHGGKISIKKKILLMNGLSST